MPQTIVPNQSSEAAIFDRVFTNGKNSMSSTLAKHVVNLSFSDSDKQRMNELARKNRDGEITAGERDELFNYVKVGDMLAILQSKARVALKKVGR